MAEASTQPQESIGSMAADFIFPSPRDFTTVRDFVGTNAAASLTLSLVGLLLTQTVSPGIPWAITSLGFAAAVVDIIVVRILLNNNNPLDNVDVGLGQAATSVLAYLGSGFILFLILGPGSLADVTTSLVQFSVGVVISYIGGVTFLLTRTYLMRKGFSMGGVGGWLFFSILTTIAVTLLLALGLPPLLDLVAPQGAELLTRTPGT